MWIENKILWHGHQLLKYYSMHVYPPEQTWSMIALIERKPQSLFAEDSHSDCLFPLLTPVNRQIGKEIDVVFFFPLPFPPCKISRNWMHLLNIMCNFLTIVTVTTLYWLGNTVTTNGQKLILTILTIFVQKLGVGG